MMPTTLGCSARRSASCKRPRHDRSSTVHRRLQVEGPALLCHRRSSLDDLQHQSGLAPRGPSPNRFFLALISKRSSHLKPKHEIIPSLQVPAATFCNSMMRYRPLQGDAQRLSAHPAGAKQSASISASRYGWMKSVSIIRVLVA